MLLIRYLVLYSVALYQFRMTIPWYNVGIELHVFFVTIHFSQPIIIEKTALYCKERSFVLLLSYQVTISLCCISSLLVPLLVPHHHNWVVIGKSNSCYIIRHIVLPLYFCEVSWLFACSCFNIHFRMRSLSLNKTKTLRNVEWDCIELLDQFGKIHLYTARRSSQSILKEISPGC